MRACALWTPTPKDLALQLMGEDGDADAHRFAYIQGIAALTSLMERAGLSSPSA